MKRFIQIGTKQYTVVFDEYGVIDTVVLTGTSELLSAKNKDVKKIVNNNDKIYNYKEVKGMSYF